MRERYAAPWASCAQTSSWWTWRATSGTLPPRRSADPWPWSTGRVRVTVFLTEEHARSTLAAAPFLRRAQHRVIHNGVDCRLFHPDEAAGRAFRERYDLPIGPLLVGVGALAPEKRWDLLLAAVALVAPPAPPLVLCGSGALEGALREQARRLGVNATFLGQVEAPTLVGAYNAATCVVDTCPDETFGLALAEAMACGRPVLAPASGGPVEVVGDAGVLAAPEDPRGFAAQLERLLADPGRRAGLGAAARRRAVERYSVGRMVRDYAELLESLG
ncbi:MAG: glycosyltransferase family 4 protein [Deltaproteobacteria bacterium]|nr:MAG: glycosyltransferase family 4 protein [Deltaproteobacteria bacterium]